ncbi:MAG: hypothetical protein MJY69_04470 [Bacteroidales bacterium]|nr:hypothetical protein [Bacteroidales bacterium]
MTNEDYINKVKRLKEIEETVKNPEVSLDSMETLIEETGRIVKECHEYTRKLREKVDSLNNIE